MELIDKEKLIAEIENRRDSFYSLSKACEKGTPAKAGFYAQAQTLEGILSFLDTLEVKEVDLENLFQALPEKISDEKSHQVYELSIYHYDGQCVVDYVGEIDHDSLYDFGGNTLYEAIEKAWNWLCKNSTGG